MAHEDCVKLINFEFIIPDEKDDNNYATEHLSLTKNGLHYTRFITPNVSYSDYYIKFIFCPICGTKYTEE